MIVDVLNGEIVDILNGVIVDVLNGEIVDVPEEATRNWIQGVLGLCGGDKARDVINECSSERCQQVNGNGGQLVQWWDECVTVMLAVSATGEKLYC